MTSEKKENRLSFRVEPELAKDLEAWASEEEIPLAQLQRKLMWIAAGLYREAGSLHELKQKFGEDPPMGKLQRSRGK